LLFKTIGLVGKFGDPSVNDTLARVGRYLIERGHDVLLDEHSAEMWPDHGFPTAERQVLGSSSNLVVVVGGDGTLLNAARSVARYEVPVLGINLGRLGFLVDISPNDCLTRLNSILAGEYQEENRILMRASIYHDGERVSDSAAFNDVVVHKWEVARMIELETYIDGYFVSTIRADGLIVSTPTGSTAYALSGGGPILHPTLNAMVLVPICPHTMSNRPIVISGDSEVEIVISETHLSDAQVTCDGQVNLGLASGDRVKVCKHDHIIRLIHPKHHDHYEILRAKLHWGKKLS